MNDFSKRYWSNNILEMITKINKVLEISKGECERMKDKLKIKIFNYKNVVLYEVLEQDKALRETGEVFKASNGWGIKSVADPVISTYCKIIYIRGSDKQHDKNIFVFRLRTAEEAKQIVKDVRQAVKEFNESQNQILDGTEKEYLRNVVKPFRNEIDYIMKEIDYARDNYYLSIYFKDGDRMNFKSFKSNTMYKNMKLDKEYTLEELGL